MAKKRKFVSHKEVSRRGGLTRAGKLSPEKRREIASLGGKTAAENKKKKKKGKNGK